jgi:hypothetical protein
MRGHWDLSHSAIALGSRPRGTRSGFWRVGPRSRSHRVRDRGLDRTPNSCSIDWADRAVLHNSVPRPCSLGLSFNHRRSIFSGVALSLLGRPGAGCAASPSGPLLGYDGDPTPDRPGGGAKELGELSGGVSLAVTLDGEEVAAFQVLRASLRFSCSRAYGRTARTDPTFMTVDSVLRSPGRVIGTSCPLVLEHTGGQGI